MTNTPNYIQSFCDTLQFPLDDFQRDAMETIDKGHSVVVCSPTGSGKTLVAEFAAHKAIEAGSRLFYTTPLKALSNQKFFDFKKQYGDENVGLLTGDISINRDARIIVMTTEIFRNMLYGIEVDPETISKVGYIVLDECHYMNDAERGTVWEESIIYCPNHVQIVALSATVANAQELTDWINQVHHDTKLIQTDFRPVPLRHLFYDRERIQPLFEAPGQMSRKLKTHHKGNKLSKQLRPFMVPLMLKELHERDMLPAIVFSFSRKDCDQFLRDTRNLSLLNDFERKQIRSIIDDYVSKNDYLKNNPTLNLIANGFAAHHAGLLPGIKHLVETLFQQGLIKAVFATETLAAGINMPARTTVITKLSKRADEGHRLLHANEFLQMSGRAGRRGMDPLGYVITVKSPYEGAREAATLASSLSDPLNSQFTPTYGMVLNLLQRHTIDEAEFLIRQSFGQFTTTRRLAPLEAEITEKTTELQSYLDFKCPENLTDAEFHGYLKSKVKLAETYHFIKILKKQLKLHGAAPEIIQQLQQEEGKRDNILTTTKSSPCETCKIIHKHEKAEDRIRRLQKQLRQLNRFYESEKDCYWQGFSNIYHLLKETGYLDDENQPTDQGRLTAQLRTENEYFITEVLCSSILNEVSPTELAGIVCALVNDSNKDNIIVKVDVSGGVRYQLSHLHKLMRQVSHKQEQFGVPTPVKINPIASGLIEAWADGLPWERLIQMTSLGEGDLVRVIRRTNDLLRQLSRLSTPHATLNQLGISPKLLETAKIALKQLDRAPVKEVEIKEITEEVINEATQKEQQ